MWTLLPSSLPEWAKTDIDQFRQFFSQVWVWSEEMEPLLLGLMPHSAVAPVAVESATFRYKVQLMRPDHRAAIVRCTLLVSREPPRYAEVFPKYPYVSVQKMIRMIQLLETPD